MKERVKLDFVVELLLFYMIVGNMALDIHVTKRHLFKGALAIRRIFSLVDMITKPKFSNCPNVYKIGLLR